MDRRKLGSKNNALLLHRHQLHSSSQLGITRTSFSQVTKDSTMPKSVSALEPSVSSSSSTYLTARKRKSSEDETSANDENDEELARAVTKKKKKAKNVIDDDDEDEEERDEQEERNAPESSSSTSSKISKSKGGDRFAKPAPRSCKSSSDREEDDEQASDSGGSYIKGVLAALDSPSKLSQSSNSSAVSKYKKKNLRSALSRSKPKKVPTKSIAERTRERVALSQASQKSASSQREEAKKSPEKPTGKKGTVQNESKDSSDESVMSFSDIEEPQKKKPKEKTPPKETASKSNKILKMTATSKDKTPPRARTPPTSSRDADLDLPDLSPIRDFQSPERNVNTRRKRTTVRNNGDNGDNGDAFIDFVNQVGIIHNSGESSHIITEDPRDIIQKAKELFASKNYNKDEIVKSWNSYINDDENIKKSLEEMKIETDGEIMVPFKAISLARLMLQIPELQIDILSSLFRKLIDSVITTDSSDDAPWANQVLQQFRFLEMLVEPDFLIKQIEELLDASPEWFQRDVILFIPDIVTDSQHGITAEVLMKIMENNSALTNIILDCMHNLNLGKDYREELREQVLGLLEKDIDKSTIPNITRFVLTACATERIALKSLFSLRNVDMAPNSQDKVDECYTHQMFMVNAIKSNIELFKEVAQAAVTIVKTPAPAKPLDLIIAILLHETSAAKKKIVEAALHSHIKDHFYKTSFLESMYTNYKEVLKSFQSTTINLSVSLLKDNSPAHTEFGVEWLRNIFISQAGTPYKQRAIMEKLLNLMSSRDKTVKNALEVLRRVSLDERQHRFFESQAAFLHNFMYKIDSLEFDEVATLYNLLHGLCTQSEKISDVLSDNLGVIMEKQLCSSKVMTKCKGVVGAVMAIKHLAIRRETSDDAFTLMRRTLNNLKSCPRSQALFYDQLGQVIASTENMDESFLSEVTTFIEESFSENCLLLSDNPTNRMEPKFRLNDPSTTESFHVNFGSGKTGATVSAFFKLLRICNLRCHGSLETINGLLGCSVLMPEDMDMPEPSTADYMIFCINWFRELIGGFVISEENLLREMVLKRLDSLMSLQGEFVSMVAMCGVRYQPPLCYFHYFPAPQFVRLDLKLSKKGKKRGRKAKGKDEEKDKDKDDSVEITQQLQKSVILPEWESWQIGSEMTIKNPAYFRRMDAKIINLLDVNMDIHSTQSSSQKITIAQVCFVVKELLGMFENQPSESFIRDVIQLLPKICAKLKKIVEDLRQNEDSVHEKEAVRLLLSLLITLFSWKEFQSARYNKLLRDGLRTLAAMMNESSGLLRSCKELVAEAYKYFESLSDIAYETSLAVALVNLCGCLMKHSSTFTEQFNDRQAKMAQGFLSLEWNNEPHGAQYRAAVKELLKSWIENEPNPLKTVCTVINWLPEKAAELERPQSRLHSLPSVTKANFYLLVKQLFSGLVKGIEISLKNAENDPERIEIWRETALCLESMSNICKAHKNNIYLTLFLRYTTMLYQILLTSGMKVLEANIKYQTNEVLTVVKSFQKTGRFLRSIFCTARKDNNVALLKIIPLAKSRRERFIYRVKGMLTANYSIKAFWMGNLRNKDLDGEEIDSKSSEDLSGGSDVAGNNTDDNVSEIFNADSDDDDVDNNDDNDDVDVSDSDSSD